jgi:WD40 repeat protein
MHAERDHLVKVVFPNLRNWCEERRLQLVDIDLRWGVTKEEADHGKAIEICLQEIDGSRPFFVCLLGNRYGWVPHDLPSEERYLFRGLQQETGLSITHLEIIHATQEPVSRKDQQRKEVCEQAFFYFRAPDCVPRPESLPDLSAGQRQEHEDAFFERNPLRRQMLEGLKGEIRERFRGQDRVWDYHGVWDTAADNPEDDKLKGRLTALDAFGERVEADLKRGIEAKFADHITTLGAAADPLAEERSAHEAFIENRTQVHVPRTDVEQKLTEYVEGDDPRPLVLCGPPGSGKSAILAHWAKERTKDERQRANGEFLLARFIGASPASTSLVRTLANVCQELVAHFALTEEVEEEGSGGRKTQRQQTMEVPADPVQLQRKWPRFLEAAAAKGRVVLVLDALNQLDRSADTARLYWAPRQLPPGLRLIVSVLDHGARSRAEYRPAPHEPADWLAVLRRHGWSEHPVPELSDDDRRRIIREVPSVFCKTLDERQVSQLLENAATRNPLFLTVALEELRVFGSHDKLSAEITGLPRLNGRETAGDIEGALEAMFGRVLARLERDTDRQAPGLVPGLFRLLASAREGLSEGELRGLLARKLGNLPAGVRQGTMQAVLRQMRPYLMRKATRQRVLVDFYHRSLWRAVRAKYLPNATARHASHRDLADWFQDQDYWLESPEAQRQRMLPPYSARPANERKVVELPWQLLELAREAVAAGAPGEIERAYAEIEHLFCDLPFLEAMSEAGMAFDLAAEFSAALAVLPADRPRRGILQLVAEALRRDVHFIARHAHDYPQALFQCLWNTCWWYDCLEAAQHYEVQPPAGPVADAAWRQNGDRLFEMLSAWRRQKEGQTPGFHWLCSLRPPPQPLGSAERSVLRGHENGVRSVSFSPDGSRLASGSCDHTARIWDVPSGMLLHVLRGHTGDVNSVAFSPDGAQVATGSWDRTVRLWDVNGGDQIVVLGGYQSFVDSVLYSADGQWIASTGDTNAVRLWNSQHWDNSRVLPPGRGILNCIAFSPDSRRLAGGFGDCGTGEVRLWDVQTGQELSVMPVPDGEIVSIAFSLDGSQIACGVFTLYEPSRDGTLRLLDARDGHTLRVVSCQGVPMAFSPDGTRVVIRCSGGMVRLVNSHSGDELARLFCGHRTLGTAAVSPDGLYLASGCGRFERDGTVRLLDLQCQRMVTPVLKGHESDVYCIAMSPDGRRIASGSADGKVRTWSAESGLELMVSKGHAVSIAQVAYSDDGGRIVAACGGDDTVRTWDAESGNLICCTSPAHDVIDTAGARLSPYQAVVLALETKIEASFDRHAIGWLPEGYYRITTERSGRTWAACRENHVYIFTLQGAPGSSS